MYFRVSDWGKENMKYLALDGRMISRDLAGTDPNFMVHQVRYSPHNDIANLPFTLIKAALYQLCTWSWNGL